VGGVNRGGGGRKRGEEEKDGGRRRGAERSRGGGGGGRERDGPSSRRVGKGEVLFPEECSRHGDPLGEDKAFSKGRMPGGD